ncbi:hypothetical protein QWA68_009539 [Fusarium oxysporum]|nr:hypothetical protein QWA68_009539 [Fusarium oxysporum]
MYVQWPWMSTYLGQRIHLPYKAHLARPTLFITSWPQDPTPRPSYISHSRFCSPSQVQGDGWLSNADFHITN